MKLNSGVLYALALLSNSSCNMNSTDTDKVIVQGHRGCRGLMPENTIGGFEHALQIGVSTLEMDVVMSADHVVVVSHEPFMNADICNYPDGRAIQQGEAEALNLYQMRYDSIARYSCGERKHPRFPDQQLQFAFKPSLAAVIENVAQYCDSNAIPKPQLNIEIKSRPEWYGSFQPFPEDFAIAIHKVLQNTASGFSITVQSFDLNVLKAFRRMYPDYKLVCLNEIQNKSMDQLFAELGFVPEYYSPHFEMVDEELVIECANRALGLAVWTVNEEADMNRMLDMGVRNIITDYPDRLNKVLKERGMLRQ